MTLLPYALAAASQGFHIFPVEPGGKTPGRLYPNRDPSEAPWTLKWSEVATTDIPTIVKWWNECPTRNIGIACKPSGLLVVDCDMKPGADGFIEWSALATRFDPVWFLAPTFMVRTGGGGCHLYYRWPSHVQASQAGLAEHVDIRSNGGQKGGYVLAAGSVTTKGPYVVEDDAPVAQAPTWLIELCRERPRVEQPARRIQQPAALSFAGLQTAVATASEGNRNQAVLWAARSMCEDGATLDDALNALVPHATGNGLTEREATDTIKSAYRLQSSKGYS